MSRIYDRPAEPSLDTDVRAAKGQTSRLANDLDEIALHCATLPVLDPRGANEIIDYDESGLPR